MQLFINVVLTMFALFFTAMLVPVAATVSVTLLVVAAAVLWMTAVHLLIARFRRVSDDDLFPLADQPRVD